MNKEVFGSKLTDRQDEQAIFPALKSTSNKRDGSHLILRSEFEDKIKELKE